MSFADHFSRAPRRGAFFVVLLVCLLAARALASDADSTRVERVLDGDTIVLDSGDTVRMLGINTPELGHGRFPDEPLANQARLYLQREIMGKPVRLENERPVPDRYGRRLARVFSESGDNLQTKLLERGLGFTVAVGEHEDFDYVAEHIEAENLAREKELGVWGDDFFRPVDAGSVANGNYRGFKRVRGSVQRVSRSRKHRVLHLNSDFRVLIPHASWTNQFSGRPDEYLGRQVEIRGWIFKTHGVSGMKIYHPAMLAVED